MGKTRNVYAYSPISGDFVQEYESVSIAERTNGLSRGRISEALSVGKKTPTGGYFWSYEKFESFDLTDAVVAPEVQPVQSTRAVPKKGISISEFRQKYDALEIIRQGARALKKGNVVLQQDFISELKLPGGVGYKDKLEASEFEPFRGQVNANKIYWGHPDDIERLKEEGLLK